MTTFKNLKQHKKQEEKLPSIVVEFVNRYNSLSEAELKNQIKAISKFAITEETMAIFVACNLLIKGV